MAAAAMAVVERGGLGGREGSCGSTFLRSASATRLSSSSSLRTDWNELHHMVDLLCRAVTSPPTEPVSTFFLLLTVLRACVVPLREIRAAV